MYIALQAPNKQCFREVGRSATRWPLCCWRVHDDVIKWKPFPRYWPFVRGIPRSPANSPHKGQWRGALMFSLICVWINGWVNNREALDLKRYSVHCDVILMFPFPHIHIMPYAIRWLSKKTPTSALLALCEGNTSVTRGFPSLKINFPV